MPRPIKGKPTGSVAPGKQPAAGSGMDTLKARLKNVSPTGLLDMLSQVKNTSPEQWKDVNSVKNMAKQFADKLNIPISDERLDQFAKAYKDATKGGEPNGNVDELVQKYGQGKVDPQTLTEMKKFIKPKK
ncbi:MAG: hypothetical protein JWN30_2636 [Bacilli bacterium]|nr:hypothetical protein [Bacilli bacterium]